MKKSPDLAAALTKKFMNGIPVELVAKVAKAVGEKSPDEGAALCRMRINEDILRSHVYYDKAMFLLSTARDIYMAKGKETEWAGFIRKFAAENKGKKKLMEKVKKEFGAVL